MRYRYLDAFGHRLRENDEIRAADGESWILLTRVEVPGPGHLPVKLWTRPRPAWNSQPDMTRSQYTKFRVRRTQV